jgi:hypothetical protein
MVFYKWDRTSATRLHILGMVLCAALGAGLDTPFVDYMSLAAQLDVNRTYGLTYGTASTTGLGSAQQGRFDCDTSLHIHALQPWLLVKC